MGIHRVSDDAHEFSGIRGYHERPEIINKCIAEALILGQVARNRNSLEKYCFDIRRIVAKSSCHSFAYGAASGDIRQKSNPVSSVSHSPELETQRDSQASRRFLNGEKCVRIRNQSKEIRFFNYKSIADRKNFNSTV